MKLYLAAPWGFKTKMPQIASLFEAAGHTIARKWWKVSAEDLEAEENRDPTALRECAIADIQGVETADTLVVINVSKSEGKSVEQGIAINAGISIIAVGERGKVSKNVFHYLDSYTWVATVQEAVSLLAKRAKQSVGCPMLDAHLEAIINPSWNYAGRLRDHQDEVMNAVSGLAAEAAEVLDEHKKLYYHLPKDRHDSIVDELGDVFYYVSKLMELHGITLQECLAANTKKLTQRHKEQFKV